MTFSFGMFTIGAMLLYSGIKNMTVADILLARPSSLPPTAPPAEQQAAAQLGGIAGKAAGGGTARFDGKTVCAAFVPILQRARQSGLWHGSVTSGVRTVAESVGACQNICGAPSCPGTCAGTASNHNGCSPGAVDVTDPAGFNRAMAQQGYPLKNDLPSDPVHFSPTGH